MERYIKIAGGKMRVILCLLVWMLVGAACDSFLDIAPSKKTNIELSKVEHLDALLAAINTTTGNTSLVLSPDITEISTDLYDKTNNGAPFYQHGIAYYLWMNRRWPIYRVPEPGVVLIKIFLRQIRYWKI